MPASRRLAWILLAILALTRHPAVAATTPAGAATPARIVRAAPDVKLQAWQARLRAVREAPGCYKAHYPDKGWTRVPCLPARLTNARPPNVRLRSQSGAHPATVGNFNDYMAQSSSGTKSAVGTIIELDNLTSESDSGFGNGKYSLQMNTAGFSPPSGVCPSCTGAVQFYYDQNGGGILVQFWMLGLHRGQGDRVSRRLAAERRGELLQERAGLQRHQRQPGRPGAGRAARERHRGDADRGGRRGRQRHDHARLRARQSSCNPRATTSSRSRDAGPTRSSTSSATSTEMPRPSTPACWRR